MKTYNNSVVLRNDGTDPSSQKDDLNAGILKTITVKIASLPTPGLGANASIFDINSGAIPNPTTTDDKGNYAFKVSDGSYDIVIEAGTANETIIPSVEISDSVSLEHVIPFGELIEAVISIDPLEIFEGAALNIKERSTGNGGGAMWDVVLASGVTPNTFEVVQCTGIATLALVLRDEGEVNWPKFGCIGDGVTDTSTSVQNAINYSVTNGLPNKMGVGTYLCLTKIEMISSDKIVIIGEGSQLSAIKGPTNTNTVAGVALRLFNCDDVTLVGFTVDGNRQGSETQISGSARPVVIIEGDVSSSAAKNLVMDDVLIKNGGYHGIRVSHYINLLVSGCKTSDVYGNGFVGTGVQNVIVDNYLSQDCGNLLASGSRSGSGMIINGRGTSTQPIQNLTINNVVIQNATDSGLYVGDGETQGNSRAAISNVVVDQSGKAGVKYESGFSNATMNNIIVRRAGNDAFRVDGSKVSCSNIIITETGFDWIGADYDGIGIGTMLNFDPQGCSLEGDDISVTNLHVDGVISSPFDGSGGQALSLRNTARCRVTATLMNSDNTGCLVNGAPDSELKLLIRDVAKTVAGTTAGITIGSFAALNSNVILELDSRDEQGTKTMDYAFRVFDDQTVILRNSRVIPSDHDIGDFTVGSNVVFIPQENLVTAIEGTIAGVTGTQPNVGIQKTVIMTNGGAANILGFSGAPFIGQVVKAISGDGNQTMKHNDAGGTNKLFNKSGADVVMAVNQGITYVYTATNIWSEV